MGFGSHSNNYQTMMISSVENGNVRCETAQFLLSTKYIVQLSYSHPLNAKPHIQQDKNAEHAQSSWKSSCSEPVTVVKPLVPIFQVSSCNVIVAHHHICISWGCMRARLHSGCVEQRYVHAFSKERFILRRVRYEACGLRRNKDDVVLCVEAK